MLNVIALAPEGSNEIILSRSYDGDLENVWDAWTQAAALAHWWAPDGCTIVTHSADIRPGGIWAFTLATPNGQTFENRHKYVELIRPKRIVYRQGERPEDDNAVLVTVTFDARDNATLVTLRIEFSSHAWREKLIEKGAIEYPTQSLIHLAKYLAGHHKEVGNA